jgi:hypothetical protein
MAEPCEKNIIPLTIFLRPSLIEVDHRLARSLRHARLMDEKTRGARDDRRQERDGNPSDALEGLHSFLPVKARAMIACGL